MKRSSSVITGIGQRTVSNFIVVALHLAFFAATAIAQDEKRTSIFDGLVEAQHSADVAASIDGRVVRIAFQVGQIVKSGDLLIELDDGALSAELQIAEGQLERTKAKLRGAEHAFEVQQSLRKKGVASETNYINAIIARDAAQAEVAEAKGKLKLAQYRLNRAKITAPISGQIGQINIRVGSFVEAKAGQLLAVIVQLDPIFVAYKVPYQSRLAAMVADKTVDEILRERTATIILPDGRSYEHVGGLQSSAPVVDPTDGTIAVRALFNNPQRLLRPGLKVKIRSKIDRK